LLSKKLVLSKLYKVNYLQMFFVLRFFCSFVMFFNFKDKNDNELNIMYNFYFVIFNMYVQVFSFINVQTLLSFHKKHFYSRYIVHF